MLMPFASAFSVHNLGIPLEKLPLIYLITGVCSIVTGPLVGQLGDSIGAFKLFCIGSIISTVMVLIYTHLGVTPLGAVILVNVIMFVGIFSRIISSQTLMSAIPEPSKRGSFMAVSAAIQQLSGGLASVFAGLIVVESANGNLEHFDILGYVVIGATVITTTMMYFIDQKVQKELKASPQPSDSSEIKSA
jgi:predicted MFS family arabinose efflux permease